MQRAKRYQHIVFFVALVSCGVLLLLTMNVSSCAQPQISSN